MLTIAGKKVLDQKFCVGRLDRVFSEDAHIIKFLSITKKLQH